MNPQTVGKTATNKTNMLASRGFRPINLVTADDGNVTLPTRIEVMKAGTWQDSVKGNLIISTVDLQQMKDNFDAGMSQPYPGFGLPIDFGHEDWDKAAGWIKALSVEGDTLYADVEWTTAGADALRGGEYKLFSPAFYPSCLGDWFDPEDMSVTAKNVLEGGALTNIPFFKDLKPIMASNSKSGGEDKNVIYINASNNVKENENMNLAEVKAKDVADITDEEKRFLADHKDELSAEEQTKFGLVETPAASEESGDDGNDGDGDDGGESTEEPSAEGQQLELPEAVAASLKKANVVMVKADRLKELEDTATEYATDKATAEIEKHIARGAVKADQKDSLVKRVLADKSFTDVLRNLPDNQVLASEQGKDESNSGASAWEQIKVKASKIVADTNGKTAFADAVKQVQTAEPALAEAYKAEREQN
jgi:hypothetical protein